MTTKEISFADYAADMKELAESGASIVREMLRRVDERDLFLAALVASNGGELRMQNSRLHNAHKLKLVLETDLSQDAMTIRVEPAT